MNPNLLPKSHSNLLVLFLAVGICALTETSQLPAAETVGDKVNAVAADAEKTLQDMTQQAKTGWGELWGRIDEKRLKNRTPDQLVSWAIMGLLVGGLIHQFSKLKKPTALLLGLAGAFIGGLAENLAQLKLGIGPVLISYEELLASLLGGVVVLLVARWVASRRSHQKG